MLSILHKLSQTRHIIVFVFLFYNWIFTFGQTAEGISQSGKVAVINSDIDVESYIKQYVENRIETWQKKGEFEKTVDYQIRVSEHTRKVKAYELSEEAFEEIKQLFIKTIKWNEFEIKGYDADHETYMLDHPVLGEIAVPVGIDKAPSFKQQFSKMTYSGYELYFTDNKFHLSKLTIKDQNGNSFYYDNKQPATYVAQNIKFNFSEIEYNIPSDDDKHNVNTNIKEENLVVGSDPVDFEIPMTYESKPNTFAVIIGNEDYLNERSVPYAINDAEVFKKYVLKTLCVPEENVHLLKDATYGQFLGEIKWITDIAMAYKGKASLIIYYAGHGMPDESTRDAYLLPSDGSSEILNTAIKLEWLYAELNKHKTKQVTVFLDACFSGAARDGMLAEARAVKVKPKDNVVLGNLIIFSATTGDQTAYPYEEKGHGMYTYYLLKKLQETKGNIDLGTLSDYLEEKVSQKSLILNNKKQTPSVNVSRELIKKWRSLKIAN